MGLDIAFSRTDAMNVGLEIKTVQNGTSDEIHQAKAEEFVDQDYVAWLQEHSVVVKVPEYPYWTDDGGMGDDVIVRANKWGTLYEPLTHWLSENGISWTEF